MVSMDKRDEPLHLHTYSYQLDEIQHHTVERSHTLCYGFVVMKSFHGTAMINHSSFPIEGNPVIAIGPQDTIKLEPSSEEETLDYFFVRFQVFKDFNHGQLAQADVRFPNHFLNEQTKGKTDLYQLAADMRQTYFNGGQWGRMKANILFQQMIVALFESAADQHDDKYDHSISNTVHFMNHCYDQEITREQLAAMAGLNADYYSRLFKKKMGKSPMEYLTEVRMNQAKLLLLQSRESFRSIGQRVGFQDEFYFSRKFKSSVGYSPTGFVKMIKSGAKIASLNHLSTGHLIALGVEPHAAVVNHAYPITQRLQCTIDVGWDAPNLEKLLNAKPDVIITCSSKNTRKSVKERLYEQIAPTISLPFFDNWRNHLQTIASIIGKEKEATVWLEQYETKAEAIREQIKSQAATEDMYLIVGVGAGKLCVYGRRNMGTVLYDDLKLPMPPGVEAVDHYKEVSMDELVQFCADRIVLTSYKHDGKPETDALLRQQVCKLFTDKRWQAMPAVKQGKVYHLYEQAHHFTSYNALTNDLLLDRLHQLLMSECCK